MDLENRCEPLSLQMLHTSKAGPYFQFNTLTPKIPMHFEKAIETMELELPCYRSTD